MNRTATLTATAALAALIPALPAQIDPSDDGRDRIVPKRGRPIECRIVDARDPLFVLYTDNGRSLDRFDRRRLQSVELLRERLAEFLPIRSAADRRDADARFALVAEAEKRRLPHLAKLCALEALLIDPDHEAANLAFGNRRIRGAWRWSRTLDGERPLVEREDAWAGGVRRSYRGEHWVVETDVEPLRAVRLLFDLEQLYVTMTDELGDALRMREVVRPMRVFAAASLERGSRFPRLRSSFPMPYLQTGQPMSDLDRSNLFYIDEQKWPVLGFDVAVEQILNKTLFNEKASLPAFAVSDPDRVAPWLEIGLGRYFGSRAKGDPGYVEFGDPELDEADGLVVLRYQTTSLENLIGLRMMAFHEPNALSALHWAECTALVAFLMDPATKVPATGRATQGLILDYLRTSFQSGKQGSSSELDKILGAKIETFERPWLEWTAAKMGRALPSRRPRVSTPFTALRTLPRGVRIYTP